MLWAAAIGCPQKKGRCLVILSNHFDIQEMSGSKRTLDLTGEMDLTGEVQKTNERCSIAISSFFQPGSSLLYVMLST
jgi:hypothetical protein